MFNFMKKIFKRDVKDTNNNVQPFNLEQDDEEFDDIILYNEINIQVKKEKHCSFCKDPSHTITKCDKMNYEIDKITEYCSIIENQINIPETRKYLQSIDSVIINRYVTKNKIKDYMYNNCYQYYNNNIKLTRNTNQKNIELIIGYLCVLPLHPEIRNKKEPKNKKQIVHCHKNHNNNNIGLFVGTQGVGVGFML